MKLIKRALECFEAEYIETTFDALVVKLRKMFRHRQSKVIKRIQGASVEDGRNSFHEYVGE
jgi:hypothetical protein